MAHCQLSLAWRCLLAPASATVASSEQAGAQTTNDDAQAAADTVATGQHDQADELPDENTATIELKDKQADFEAARARRQARFMKPQ